MESTNQIDKFFAPVLPWQQEIWQDLLARHQRLPHGLLFAGMQGIGKHEFVWRFVAWLLCDNRQQEKQPTGDSIACGECQSCQWLASGTHPDLMVLPISSLPTALNSEITEDSNSSSKSKKSAKSKKKSAVSQKTSAVSGGSSATNATIKVDDIRELQPFISQGSTGRRICIIDNADKMTVAAANALLKTLEEPRQGIHLFLISDMPAKLLPTIKSRVQQVAIDHIDRHKVKDYLLNLIKAQQKIEFKDDDELIEKISQALHLANGAPLAAIEILYSEWYQQRKSWLQTWLALRVGKRTSIAASDYWQTVLSLDDFIKLTEVMLMDFSRQSIAIDTLQQDIDLASYDSINALTMDAIQNVLAVIDDIKLSRQQNVQDKFAYDLLLSTMATL